MVTCDHAVHFLNEILKIGRVIAIFVCRAYLLIILKLCISELKMAIAQSFLKISSSIFFAITHILIEENDSSLKRGIIVRYEGPFFGRGGGSVLGAKEGVPTIFFFSFFHMSTYK